VADKEHVRFENNTYFITDRDTDEKVVVFWHGRETRAAQRALDALIQWREYRKRESIARIIAFVTGDVESDK
jgi:hypothetical protein